VTAVAAPPRERPILFSGDMVRAILDGRKSQTRRVVKLPTWMVRKGASLTYAHANHSTFSVWLPENDCYGTVMCPYGLPGDHVVSEPADRLWVREAWLSWRWNDDVRPAEFVRLWGDDDPRKYVGYIADKDTVRDGIGMDGRLRASMHMPRWASRILLEIADVRVERVQDITYADLLAEGCPSESPGASPEDYAWYRTLWDSMNAKRGYSWDSNPWVWCIEFRRITL
jgi:hypothetical protein